MSECEHGIPEPERQAIVSLEVVSSTSRQPLEDSERTRARFAEMNETCSPILFFLYKNTKRIKK